MSASLSYTEQILEQMHTRALRGVLLALGFSALVHLGVTLVQLGGDSFAIRFDRPVQSGEALRAELRVQPAPTPPAAPSVTPPTPVTPAPPPLLRDRATVNMVERDRLTPIEPVPTPPLPNETIPMPAPLPEPVTRRFETDRSNSPTRVERSERLPTVQPPSSVPPLDLKPLPPLDITPAKREPLPQKQSEAPKAAEAAKPIEPPTPSSAEPARADAAKPAEPPKSAPNDASTSAAAEPPKTEPAPTAPAPNAAAPPLSPPSAATPAVTPTPQSAPPVLATPAQPSASAPAPTIPAPSGGAPPASGAVSGASPSAGGSRGATVTLPSPAGSTGAAAGAAGAPGGASGEREGALRPGLIDGFDPNAARRNAARDAARDLNARRSLVPPSVAPSPSAREREAKAIENAIREDCKDAAKDIGLLNIPSVVGGALFDKGCRIR